MPNMTIPPLAIVCILLLSGCSSSTARIDAVTETSYTSRVKLNWLTYANGTVSYDGKHITLPPGKRVQFEMVDDGDQRVADIWVDGIWIQQIRSTSR